VNAAELRAELANVPDDALVKVRVERVSGRPSRFAAGRATQVFYLERVNTVVIERTERASA
jgi:hypothetical protein